MRRQGIVTSAAALALAAASTGCLGLAVTAGAGLAVTTPGAVGGLAGKDGKGDGVVELGYADVRGGGEHGGGGVIRSAGFRGLGRHVLYAHGRSEAGIYGRDHRYGFTGADFGPGLQLAPRVVVALSAGYSYGGYPQNGHTFPVRASLYMGAVPHLLLHGSVYAGWRVGVRDEYPHAAGSFGPGWNTWGGDAGLALTGRWQGLGLAAAYDRQDDIGVVTLHVTAALRLVGP